MYWFNNKEIEIEIVLIVMDLRVIVCMGIVFIVNGDNYLLI